MDIVSKNLKCIIWGMGYIGLSSGVRFVNAGQQCLGYDISKHLIDSLKGGHCPFPGFEDWMEAKISDTVKKGFSFFSELTKNQIDETDMHLISVNTDLDGEPYKGNLIKVIREITSNVYSDKKRYIIIQSTVSVEWIDQIRELTGGFVLVVAPRRDWFIGQEKKNQKTIPQVIGTDIPEEVPFIQSLFSLVSDSVLVATDCKHAALVKTVENTIRYLNIIFTNQIAMEYPDMNIAEVFELCSSKWNIPYYHPSLGIGGYCIPIAPKYLISRLCKDGTAKSNGPCLLSSAKEVEEMHRKYVKDILTKKTGNSILVLGISYAPNIKVTKLSPAFELIKSAIEHGDDVHVHDPYFSPEEILELTKAKYYDYEAANTLEDFDQVFVVSCHKEYKDIKDKLPSNPQKKPMIIDNLGDLKSTLKKSEINYFEVGSGLCQIL